MKSFICFWLIVISTFYFLIDFTLNTKYSLYYLNIYLQLLFTYFFTHSYLTQLYNCYKLHINDMILHTCYDMNIYIKEFFSIDELSVTVLFHHTNLIVTNKKRLIILIQLKNDNSVILI